MFKPPRCKQLTAATVFSICDSIRSKGDELNKEFDCRSLSTSEWLQAVFESYKKTMMGSDGARFEIISSTAFPSETETTRRQDPSSNQYYPIPDAIVQRILAFRVSQLRKELKKRKANTNGLKKELQERLLEFTKQEIISSSCTESDNRFPTYKRDCIDPKKQMGDEVKDVEMIDVDVPSAVEEMDLDAKLSPEGDKEIDVCDPCDAALENSCSPKLPHIPEPKSETTMEPKSSDRKRIRSPFKVVVDTVKRSPSGGERASKVSKITADSNMAKNNIRKSPQGLATQNESHPATAPMGHHSAPVKLLAGTTIISGQTRNPHSATSALKSQIVKDKNEERRAKLAEIRGKSKPFSEANKLNSGTTFVKSMTINPTLEKSSSIIDKIRQKHFNNLQGNALARSNLESSVVGEKTSEKPNTNSPIKGTSSAIKSATLSPKTKSATLSSATKKVTLSSSAMPAVAVKPRTPASAKKSPDLFSPMSTYEISDHDDSSSDESDASNGRKGKPIPSWAQKQNLVPSLERQYSSCIHDPDEIFGEVQTCDLEEIFGHKSVRYQKRNSTGNWTKDKVTAAEKLAYKRTALASALP